MWPVLLGLDLIDLVVAEKLFSSLVVCDDNKFHRPYRRGEDKCGLVGLFVGRMCPTGIRMRVDML